MALVSSNAGMWLKDEQLSEYCLDYMPYIWEKMIVHCLLFAVYKISTDNSDRQVDKILVQIARLAKLLSIWHCVLCISGFVSALSGAERVHTYRKIMLRSVSYSKQFLLLETLTRLDPVNCRPSMIPLSRSSELLCCTLLRIPGSRAFHTNFCQRQLKQKDSERHNTLIEAKDKPFSELTLGEKGENLKICAFWRHSCVLTNLFHLSFVCFIKKLPILLYFVCHLCTKCTKF